MFENRNRDSERLRQTQRERSQKTRLPASRKYYFSVSRPSLFLQFYSFVLLPNAILRYLEAVYNIIPHHMSMQSRPIQQARYKRYHIPLTLTHVTKFRQFAKDNVLFHDSGICSLLLLSSCHVSGYL